MALVSIIVPSFNHAPYLEQRIQSILDQTFSDYDILVLDDASTDGSQEILHALVKKHPGIRLDCNQQNSGSAFRQWNRGLRCATGKYIWIAESDDFAAPTFLQTLVALLEQHPGVGVAYCRSAYVDAAGATQAARQWMETLPGERWCSDFLADGREEIRRYLVFGNTIPNASAVLFRRDLVRTCGYVDERYSFAGDWWYWSRLLNHADLAYSAQTLNFFRRHGTSFSCAQTGSREQFIEYQQVPFTVARSVHAPPAVFSHLERQCWRSLLLRKRTGTESLTGTVFLGLRCLLQVPLRIFHMPVALVQILRERQQKADSQAEQIV